MTSKERQRELERARYERVQARLAQQQAAAKKRNKITAAVAAVLVVGIGVGVTVLTKSSDDKKTPAASTAPTSPSSAATTPDPNASSSPAQVGYQKTGNAAKDVGVPTYDAAAAAKPYTATLHFDSGDLTFDALTTKAPYTTYSFEYLAKKGYFDNTKCHRLTTQNIYVLQCGDPAGTGAGGPGYQFQDENLTGAAYPAGTIAMANAGPGTNGSQFFIVYKDTQLPPNYTPWGKITGSMDVVTKIVAGGEVDADPSRPGDGKPKLPATIKSVTIK
ncbi:MAG: peptidylprolyl isomerase [Catenulisporales bacterium]|nr:peptidylprolyl isomerase [Catenulisporales bacterium]